MVIWHQRHLEESPVQHDASLLTAMSLSKVRPLLNPSPPHAETTGDPVPRIVGKPTKVDPIVPAAEMLTTEKPTYRRQARPVAGPPNSAVVVPEVNSKAPTTTKLPDPVSDRSKGKATSEKSKKKKENHMAVVDASSSSDKSVDSAPVPVYMDWGRGNLAFTLANYRSLESLLAHHPKAEVKEWASRSPYRRRTIAICLHFSFNSSFILLSVCSRVYDFVAIEMYAY